MLQRLLGLAFICDEGGTSSYSYNFHCYSDTYCLRYALNGILRTTPWSFLFSTPTPSALSPSNGMPSIHGHSNKNGKGSPIFATPRGYSIAAHSGCSSCLCNNYTVIYKCLGCNAISPPSLWLSGNNYDITIMPAPASRVSDYICKYISLQDHCPYFSIAVSWIATTTISWDVSDHED